jgi:hypothetical protein
MNKKPIWDKNFNKSNNINYRDGDNLLSTTIWENQSLTMLIKNWQMYNSPKHKTTDSLGSMVRKYDKSAHEKK